MPGKKASEVMRREQILKAAHDIALRRGIDGVTLRAVAAKARLSHALVLFHFKRKDQLVSALLDRVLATTLSLAVAEDVTSLREPRERLRALLHQEVNRLYANPRPVRLLLEYWALGTQNRVIREKITVELERYRGAFRMLAEEVLHSEPSRLSGMTAHGLAAASVSFIHGCAVQAMIAPDRFDVGEYLTTVQGILGRVPLAA